MNLTPIGPGRYALDAYLPSGARLRRVITATSVRLARKAAQEMIARHTEKASKALEDADQGPTLEDAYKRAWRTRKGWIESRSRMTIEDNWAYVKKALKAESFRMRKVSKGTMEDFRDRMLEEGLSASTINQRLSLVSACCEAVGLDFPRKVRLSPGAGRTRTLSVAEEDTALDYFAKKAKKGSPVAAEMYDLVQVLIDTGMRLTEALSIGVTGTKGAPLVKYERTTGRFRISAEVSKSGRARTIPATPRVQSIMERRAGFSLSKWSADRAWGYHRAAAGLRSDREYVLHALRHTCATRLAEAGMDAFRIQQWMGHASITTTMIYVNLAAAHLGILADALTNYREMRRTSGLPSSPPESPPSEPLNPLCHQPQTEARPESEPGNGRGSGLLIRRSLVRAQVGEPRH